MKFVLISLFLIISCDKEPENKAVSLARKVREMQLKGIISGFDCSTVHIRCPEEHHDHRETLGLIDNESIEFSFLVNIPQSFIKQYFLDSVEVKGKIYNGVENAVQPTQISVLNKEGKLKTIFINNEFLDEYNHKSTFEVGGIRNGKWFCKECLEHFDKNKN